MRLNHSYHRILNLSPFELKKKYSYLDPLGRETNKIEESIKRTLRNIKWEEKKRNKARDISYEFKIGDEIFIKLKSTKKLDDPYNGPVKIIGLMKNRCLVHLDGRNEWVNYKRIKPCPRYSPSPTQEFK
ncbi:hypothetical protein HZS_7939 [Henneguya salminicola]|nr:hypothetical protein HZS_7939 [Henneguya salminicola]